MEKEDLKGYIEFYSRLVDCNLNVSLKELNEAADRTQIHTFGWPVGVVMHNVDEYRPKPVSQDTIRAVIDSGSHFDFWTLSKSGEYYILSDFFEDQRSQELKIYLDTRIIRITETLLRTARLYDALGVPTENVMICRFEFGGLLNRSLTAANPMRAFTMHERRCTANTVHCEYQDKIENFLKNEPLKSYVFDTIKQVTEMCDFFVPSKEQVVDVLVDNYINGKIV